MADFLYDNAENISFEKELEKLRSVIIGIAHRFPEQHRDDLIQEGVLGLYSAVQSFNSSKGVPFEAFAVLCIKRRMYSYCNHFIKNDTNYANETENLESDEVLEEDVLQKTHIEDLFAKLKQNLSEMEKNVLELYLKDLSYAEISSKLSIAEKSVDNAMSRIKAKLKKIFEAEN